MDYATARRLVEGQRLPLAVVDLDAFDANLKTLLAAAGGKRLRVATKSVRVPELLRRALHAGARGLMTFTASETAFLAREGFDDLLLAYPTGLAADARDLAAVCEKLAGVAVDSEAHVALLEATGAKIPCAIDVDVSYRPIESIHLGVRRSPLREPAEVVALASRIARSPSLRFAGLIAYEAQIAGLPDSSAAIRAMKMLSRRDVASARQRIFDALEASGLECPIFNGAGTGSLHSAAAEPALTELTAGSGLLAGHLFDDYRNLRLQPALHFALQVARIAAKDIVTCQGGGIIASGEPGPSRLPKPVLPEGVRLLPREGAGEVQTPLQCARGVHLQPGDPVFFRPAKSGEPLERFAEVLLVEDGRVAGQAATYRGMGQCFL